MPRAISFSSYGEAEVLALVDLPSPDPDPGQVRVAVRAASVNPIKRRAERTSAGVAPTTIRREPMASNAG